MTETRGAEGSEQAGGAGIIAGGALLIGAGNAASRVLGLVREQVIAALFGRSGATDAFVAAITVPTMVYDLVIGGAVSAALIPVFSGYAERLETLRRVASTMLTLSALALGLVVALLWAFAEGVLELLVPGLAPANRALALQLVRITLPAVVLLGVAGILTALLYARQIFSYPAFSTAFYNAGIILCALTLAPMLGPVSLAVGTLAGALLQVTILLPGLRGLRLRPLLDLNHPGVRRILILYAPVAAGLVISQLGVFIDRNLASRAGEGAMAAMRFATTLVQFPLGLVVLAVGYAVLPSLSRFAGEDGRGEEGGGDPAAYSRTLLGGMRFALFLILPALAGLLILREPLVRLIFERGAFAAGDTARTAWILLFYLPQLPFVAVDQLLIFAFYARRNTLTPMLVGLMGVATYVVAGVSLLEPMGAAGLALANSLQHAVHALVLLVLLWRYVPALLSRELWLPLLRLVGATLLMALPVQAAYSWLVAAYGEATGWALLAQVGLLAGFGAVAYLLAAAALRSPELAMGVRLLGSRLGRRR